MNGFTFDAGALIALERGDRRVLALLAEAERCGAFIVVPATVTRTRDIADAHVVVCAMASGQPIVTSDPVDLRKLSAEVELVVL